MTRPQATPTIRALKKVPRRKEYLLDLSDGTELKVTEDDISGFSLAAGCEITEATRAELAGRYAFARAMDSALRLLKVRPRTEGEIRRSLRTRGWAGPVADRVVEALKARGQVDDRIFARLWATEKFRGGSTGKRRVLAELRARMVDADVAEEETGEVYASESEAELARELAKRRACRMSGMPVESRKRRLYGHLLRRGFESEVAAQATQSALSAQERGESQDGAGPEGRARPRGPMGRRDRAGSLDEKGEHEI
jgi:regulatory protein